VLPSVLGFPPLARSISPGVPALVLAVFKLAKSLPKDGSWQVSEEHLLRLVSSLDGMAVGKSVRSRTLPKDGIG